VAAAMREPRTQTEAEGNRGKRPRDDWSSRHRRIQHRCQRLARTLGAEAGGALPKGASSHNVVWC